MARPVVLKLFHVRYDVSRGIAMGTTSHGAGVQRALQANKHRGYELGCPLVWQEDFEAYLVHPCMSK
jgi:putative effector of murein hydrolase